MRIVLEHSLSSMEEQAGRRLIEGFAATLEDA
jgi:hypothetical protein